MQPGWVAALVSLAASYLPTMTAPRMSCVSTQAVGKGQSGLPKRLPTNGSGSRSTGTAHIAVGQKARAELHVIFQVK